MQKIFQSKKLFFILTTIFLLAYFINFFYVLNDVQGNKFLLYTRRILDTDLHVLNYSRLSNIILNKEFPTSFEKIGNDYQISLSGFPPSFLMRNVPEEIHRKGLHPSFRLGLYSMDYGRVALRRYDQTGDSELFDQLRKITKAVLNDIESFRLVPEPFHYNDHSISERVEFLLLMKAKLQETKGNESLINQIDRHIRYCIDLLIDDNRFTWITNHGTMQIRALLHIASATLDSNLRKKCLDLALKRIREVLPMFIADDGAILESASGYWIYIFRQWDYISKMKILPPDLRALIQKRLNNSKTFIETIITSDGFLQGVGDSFNQVVDENLFTPSSQNQASSFSNGLAVLKWTVGSIMHQLLFVSLDTPPNVHKLPEDLAVYLYVGEPFFISTGTYAYGSSPERKYVRSEISQSTVSFLNPSKPTYSKISDIRIDEDSARIALEGQKWYGNDSIKRNIVFYPRRGNIEITDVSSKQLSSKFNLHPNVTIQRITNDSIILTGENETLTIEYEGQLRKSARWVSRKMFDKTPIEQLEFIGNPIKLRIKFSHFVTDFGFTVRAFKPYAQRSIIAERLSQRYSKRKPLPNFRIKAFLLFRVLIFTVFLASLLFARKEGLRFFSVILLTCISATLIIDILTEGGFLTNIVYFFRRMIQL